MRIDSKFFKRKRERKWETCSTIRKKLLNKGNFLKYTGAERDW